MTYKGINMDIIDSIHQNSDDGYIIVGEKDSDLYVIELEKAGPFPVASFTYSPDYRIHFKKHGILTFVII